MLTDLVEVNTTDDLSLSGAYFAAQGKSKLGIDSLIYFHGDGGHFYSRLLLRLGQLFSAQGVAFLAANRRGHDLVATGARGGPLKGYAYESVVDSRIDYAAWLEFLRERGHSQIAIGGHSGGAVRATYAQANEAYANVSAVVSVSPGEYNHQAVIGVHSGDFLSPYQQAKRHISEGRPDAMLRPGVPWGSVWTASAFVDCFNEDNRYSVSTHAANTGVPTLYVFGGRESEIGGEEELPVCGLAMRTLTKLSYPHTSIRVVEGANHGYVGREQELMRVIYEFFQSI